MWAVAVHVTVAVGGASVAEEEGHLVGRLLAQSQEVPEHVRVLCVERQTCGVGLYMMHTRLYKMDTQLYKIHTQLDKMNAQLYKMHTRL